MTADSLVPLVTALRDLARWLRATRARAAIIGGVAAAVLEMPELVADLEKAMARRRPTRGKRAR